MKMTHKRVLALMSISALGIAGVAWAQSKVKLVINGNPVYTTTRTIGGKTYVPLNDVATALKMKVYSSGGQITLRPAGGTYQIANKLQGKMGEELFSGKWGFKVLSIQRTPVYNFRYVNRYQTQERIEAQGNEELVILNCRLRNGTKVKDEFAFSTGNYGVMNTALTDNDAQSYQPTAIDVMADESAPLGKIALPGASINFALIFRVPKDTQIKDLVYSVVRYAERADNKSTDFRVSLQP